VYVHLAEKPAVRSKWPGNRDTKLLRRTIARLNDRSGHFGAVDDWSWAGQRRSPWLCLLFDPKATVANDCFRASFTLLNGDLDAEHGLGRPYRPRRVLLSQMQP
jgi:hypothetical protein